MELAIEEKELSEMNLEGSLGKSRANSLATI